MKPALRILAVCCLLSAPAQAQITDLVGSLIDHVPQTPVNVLTFSPIVVVASVTSNLPVGPAVNSIWTPSLELRRHTVNCTLEETLRLDSEERLPSEFSFDYFSLSVPGAYNPYHKFFFEAEPGHRYIFGLIRQGGVLRSIGDVGRYSIPLFGGHPQGTPVPDPTPAALAPPTFERVADIVLNLGPGSDQEAFARKLQDYVLISEVLSSRPGTLKRLRELLQSPPVVRAGACFELNRYFPGQYQCLAALARDVEQPPTIRENARVRLQDTMRLEGIRLRELLDPAQLGYSPMARPDSLHDNQQELTMLLDHPDPEVRSRACIALRRYFPRSDSARHCPVFK